MKSATKKFAVINRNKSNDKIVLPMNLNALNHLASLYGEDDNVDTEYFELFNTGYSSHNRYDAIIRMAKLSRWASVYSVRKKLIHEYHGSDNTFLRMMDADVRITGRFFEHLQSSTNLKWIEEGAKKLMIVDETMIPDGLTESFVRKNKLVKKGDISEIYGDTSIMSYHYSQWHPEIESMFTKLMDRTYGAVNFGFEAEKVHEELAEEGIAMKLAHETGYKKEYDGSLGSEGFELISPVLPLFNQDVISQSISPVRELLNANTNDSCGGHMNISKNGETSREVLKAIKGSTPLLYMLYQKRLNNRYCEVKNFSTYLRSPRKYSAMYLKNNNILEIRLFPAIKNTKVLQSRIELMRIIMGELYGKSAIKVLIELANPTSKLHNFILNTILDGNREKLIEKIKQFVNLSEVYKCGKISLPTKKKINKLMETEIFNIPVPQQTIEVQQEVDMSQVDEVITTSDVAEVINDVVTDDVNEYWNDVMTETRVHGEFYSNSTDYLWGSNDSSTYMCTLFNQTRNFVNNMREADDISLRFSNLMSETISQNTHAQRITSTPIHEMIMKFDAEYNDSLNYDERRIPQTDMVVSLHCFFIASYYLRITNSLWFNGVQGVMTNGDSSSEIFYSVRRDPSGNTVGFFGLQGEGIQWIVEKNLRNRKYKFRKLQNISVDDNR